MARIGGKAMGGTRARSRGATRSREGGDEGGPARWPLKNTNGPRKIRSICPKTPPRTCALARVGDAVDRFTDLEELNWASWEGGWGGRQSAFRRGFQDG